MAKVNPIEAQKYLSGVSYPMSKDELVSTAQEQDAPDDVLEALRSIDDRSYDGPNAVTAAMADAGSTDAGESRS